MNKTEQIWHRWGYQDKMAYPTEHNEALLQEAWDILKNEVDDGIVPWDTFFASFPHYRNGMLAATEILDLIN